MKHRGRGLTLIELAVALAVIAILIMQAAPGFKAWIQNTQTRTETDSIQSGLQLARSEAIRRNRSVMFWLTNPPQADWLVGCSNPVGAGAQPEATGDCPGSATGGGVPPAGPPYNWIQRQAAADQQTANAQVAVTPVGATNVTFNSLGMVTTNIDGTASITKIDVSNQFVTGPLARPLQIQVSGGQIRMCDPNLVLATDPRGCQ